MAGTRVDDALSRSRAMLVVDRVVRRDLSLILRFRPILLRDYAASVARAVSDLEQLPPLADADSADCMVGLTFDLSRRLGASTGG